MEPHEFALAVITNDDAKITKIPGIGKKTAARMVLELKDKMKIELEDVATENSEIKETISYNENIEEAISALQVLGYNRKEIEKAFEKTDLKELSVEDIIRKGLVILSRD